MSEIQSQYKYDDETGMLTRIDTQDVEGIIEANRQERNSGDNDQKGKNGRKFASVPLVVLEDIKNRLGIDYMQFGIDPDHTVRFLQWLQENQAFRTSEAKLGNGSRFV